MKFTNNELEILSQFVKCRNSNKIKEKDWRITANFDYILNAFIRHDLIKHKKFSLADTIALKYSLKELKTFCKEMKLKVSGTKNVLAQNIINFDPDKALNLIKNFDTSVYYICTENGLSVVETYLQNKEIAISETKQTIFDFLAKKDYAGMVNFVDKYRTFDLFERTDFKNTVACNPRILFYIKFLNEDTPQILKHLSKETISKLREKAIFEDLYKIKLSKNRYKIDYSLNRDLYLFRDYAGTKAFTLFLYNDMKEIYPDQEIKVKIDNREMPGCENCILIKNLYDISDMPEIPYAGCLNKNNEHICFPKLIKI